MDAKRFIEEQLRSTGWAPVHHQLALMLCPDVARAWHDFAAYLNSPASLLRQFERTALCRAKVDGFETVLILYRDSTVLAERIRFLTGGQVELVEDAALPTIAEPRGVELRRSRGLKLGGIRCVPSLPLYWQRALSQGAFS